MSAEKCSTPPVCTTTGPATTAMRPPDFFTSRIICAMRATLPSTRRSDETSLLMNAKPRRSRSRNSGVTRMPSCPHTIGLARLDVAQLPALGASVGGDDDGVHALLVDFDPAALEADVRAVVGRRVEVVGHAAILLRRLDERVALAHRVAAERRSAAAAGRRGPPARPAVMRISSSETSSLVRPMSNFRIS